MKRIPIYDDTAPVTCTIGDDEIPERIALVERMRTNLDRIERTEHGLLLHFSANGEVEADVRTFAVDEKRCCEFWGFALESTPEEIRLRWDGPPATDDLLSRLLAYFEGEEALTSISGLL